MKLRQWQAILIAYGILLVGTETELASLAVIFAWGIAAVYVFDALKPGQSVFSGLFPSGGTSIIPAPGVSPINVPANAVPATINTHCPDGSVYSFLTGGCLPTGLPPGYSPAFGGSQ